MTESNEVSHTAQVACSPDKAFTRFTDDIGSWWPKPYSWSGEALENILIDARPGGAVTELGPLGFRCDFGRVLAVEPGKRLVFSWQISPRREPQPNPENASEVEVSFVPNDNSGATVILIHRNFERHGEGYEAYREAMGSEQGWPLILNAFAANA